MDILTQTIPYPVQIDAESALAAGRPMVTLGVRDRNVTVRSIYEHYGFMVYGRMEKDDWYGSYNIALTGQLACATAEPGDMHIPDNGEYTITSPRFADSPWPTNPICRCRRPWLPWRDVLWFA